MRNYNVYLHFPSLPIHGCTSCINRNTCQFLENFHTKLQSTSTLNWTYKHAHTHISSFASLYSLCVRCQGNHTASDVWFQPCQVCKHECVSKRNRACLVALKASNAKSFKWPPAGIDYVTSMYMHILNVSHAHCSLYQCMTQH